MRIDLHHMTHQWEDVAAIRKKIKSALIFRILSVDVDTNRKNLNGYASQHSRPRRTGLLKILIFLRALTASMMLRMISPVLPGSFAAI